MIWNSISSSSSIHFSLLLRVFVLMVWRQMCADGRRAMTCLHGRRSRITSASFFSTCCCGGCYYYFLLVWIFFKRNNLTSGQQQQHPIIKLNERRRNVQTHTGDIVQWTGLFLSVYFTSFFFHSTSNFEYSKFQTLIWLEKSFKIFIFLNLTRNFQYFKF